MNTEGIEAVVVETHNWGKTAKFWQTVGFKLAFETDHNSGQFTSGDGPYVFVVEVPETQEPRLRVVLKTPEGDGDGLDVVAPFEETHYGTTEMTIRDPDGRHWVLQR
ncbi:VOC family protein [Amycolatopsis pithecellobii]|uniref:VOC family protein n=1 Tax=Amycolatopsis pithecellobii TaxID=664692 RepID=A0A6N7Z3Q0_9PSEU|nr:VOC family protein [Amycolatopsis pithecellobii]MTD55799.1 VOC family protein [Amycolatopsis pithecellobii]